MRKQMTRQQDLFEEVVRGTLVSEEMQPELVTQLALELKSEVVYGGVEAGN